MYNITGRILQQMPTAPQALNVNRQRTTIENYFRKRKLAHRPQNRQRIKLTTPNRIVIRTQPLHQRVTNQSAYRMQKEKQPTRTPFPPYLPSVPPHELHRVSAAHDWHLRRNHIDPHTIRRMAAIGPKFGLPRIISRGVPPISCSGCAIGPMQRAHHTGITKRPISGHTIAAYLAGPLPRTPAGYRYVLIITELYTRFQIAYLLRDKSDTQEKQQAALIAILRHFGNRPAHL